MIAHQKIIRDKRAKEEAGEHLFGAYWENINTDISNAIIKPINFKEAEKIILKYEWLGTLPVNYTKFCGLYFDSILAGAICFVAVKFGGKYSLYNYPAICLGRGACVHWSPNWSASYLIQNGLKLLFKKNEPTYIVAFTDSNAGEIGTIYQACSWFYLGSKETIEWICPKGKRYDINTPAVRAVTGFERRNNKELRATKSQIEHQKSIMLGNGYKLQKGASRGKYATITGQKNKKYREMLNLLEKNKKPYPVRNKYQEGYATTK
jgi:hypothetical protein|tara:strand:- start:48 stop:839 length:792 start_codon:yes stop_codon:yes gene_type:complete